MAIVKVAVDLDTLRSVLEKNTFPEPNSGCWLWAGSWTKSGYGNIGAGGRRAGNIYAHRASYLLHIGSIPDKAMVLHRCDTPCCVNPDHLYLGDDKLNGLDRVTRDRLWNVAKLTKDDVRAIRSDPRPSRVLASEYRVHVDTIWNARSRRTWVNVD